MVTKFEFQWIWFFVAFSVGILYVYLVHPKPPVVIKFPTPLNAGKVIYKDTSGTCYVYNAKPTKCTPDAIEQNIVQSM
jgi:hypothetical protein